MAYTTKAEKFFGEEERKRLREATKSAESLTNGEIVVMVVEDSDHYRDAEVIGGIFSGGLFSFLITVAFFKSSLWFFIPLSFIFFLPSWLLFRKVPTLKMTFTTGERRREAVQQRALRAFYEKGLHRTKMNTGVLFFLSLLERKVWVLADRGIYEKIDEETLNRFAGTVTQGVRDHHACDALCESIRQMGELLARHFPKTREDNDELSDEVIT
jgi:putative membrane protein